MSPQDSANASTGQAHRKQSFNIYTMMLILSVFALITAITLLWMECASYGDFPWWDTSRAAGPSAMREVSPSGLAHVAQLASVELASSGSSTLS